MGRSQTAVDRHPVSDTGFCGIHAHTSGERNGNRTIGRNGPGSSNGDHILIRYRRDGNAAAGFCVPGFGQEQIFDIFKGEVVVEIAKRVAGFVITTAENTTQQR